MADIKTKDTATRLTATTENAAAKAYKLKRTVEMLKQNAERSYNTNASSVDEYASEQYEHSVELVSSETAHQTEKAGSSTVSYTKKGIRKVKEHIQKGKETFQSSATDSCQPNTAENPIRHQNYNNPKGQSDKTGKKTIKTIDRNSKRTIKQSGRSAGNRSIKTIGEKTVKSNVSSIKNAERTGKATIKTAEQTAKVAKKTAKASAEATRRSAQATRAAKRAAVRTAKAVVRATKVIIKAIKKVFEGISAFIAAGGWVAVIIIIIILAAILACSGIFGVVAGGDSQSVTIRNAVQEINSEYQQKISDIQAKNTYEVFEIDGEPAWKEVVAVYSTKLYDGTDKSPDIITMTDQRKKLLRQIFNDINIVTYHTEQRQETIRQELVDVHGNVKIIETTISRLYLVVDVENLNLAAIVAKYGFDKTQTAYLTDLLKPENDKLWDSVLGSLSVG